MGLWARLDEFLDACRGPAIPVEAVDFMRWVSWIWAWPLSFLESHVYRPLSGDYPRDWFEDHGRICFMHAFPVVLTLAFLSVLARQLASIPRLVFPCPDPIGSRAIDARPVWLVTMDADGAHYNVFLSEEKAVRAAEQLRRHMGLGPDASPPDVVEVLEGEGFGAAPRCTHLIGGRARTQRLRSDGC